MRIGVVFPQTEIGADAGAIRAYATAATELGYTHLLAYDHVLGADASVRPGWAGYTHLDTFHEPFVLFGFLAGFCPLELVTGVIVLPQRQTALVAKQAAEVDIVTGGRLRLGVGIGWNAVEYEALGEDFRTRGKRLEEQIAVMRRLWTEPLVDLDSEYHTITAAGLAPLPVQQPIPIWLGATSAPRGLRRVGRLADGWFPQFQPGAELDDALAVVHEGMQEAGRDPATLGLEGRVTPRPGELDTLADKLDAWRAVGATHLSFNTMNLGFASVDEHIALLRDAAAAIKLQPGQ
jgi:probable F420-dependent oxidoreductase